MVQPFLFKSRIRYFKKARNTPFAVLDDEGAFVT